MWKHTCLVLATVAVASGFYTQYTFPQVISSQPHVRATQDKKYDCPHEGFFINPRNCSQFYRCVDYTGTGYVYSVYAFECPRFHVFILDGDNSTCVPGTECQPGSQTASHVASSTTQRPSVTPSGTISIAPSVIGDSDDGSSGTDGTTSGGLRPLPVRPTTRPTLPPPPGVPLPANPIVTPGPPVVDCLGQYVQHESFCNVYYKCSYETDKFLCPAGSVFDTVRQMCRIQAADEDLCGGKSIYSLSFRYVNSVPLGNIGSPQQYIVPQSHANYLAYFNPQHPLRINQQQSPLHYIQPITTQFTQTFITHPEPNSDSVHPRQYHRVVDGDRTEPKNVHPRQYYRIIDEASESIDNPRQYYRIFNEARRLQPEFGVDEASESIDNPRQYYRIFNEASQLQPEFGVDNPRQYHRLIEESSQPQLNLEIDASEFY